MGIGAVQRLPLLPPAALTADGAVPMGMGALAVAAAAAAVLLLLLLLFGFTALVRPADFTGRL